MAVTPNDVSVWLDALAGSHDRLCDLVGELDAEELGGRSYCDDWTIAQVLSHIGSGAEILDMTVDAVVAGEAPPAPETFPNIWARWNAMAPAELREASLAADGELVEKLEHLGDDLCDLEFTLFGGVRLDAVGLLRVRLSEHALHTWDIAVALDPKARVDRDAVTLLLDRLPMMLGRLGKPDRAAPALPFMVRIVTSEPSGVLDLEVGDSVVSSPAATSAAVTSPGGNGGGALVLHLPAEALVRLVYGRLDPDHSPDVGPDEMAALDTLRPVFPGF